MPATERNEARPRVAPGVSMQDLLAACAAARAISTPPREPDPRASHPPVRHREAA
ncbi:hypothetical protein [Streptomyces sp. NPDC052701]|uniref:hypothetical protein n=1 Tax=Streptomyces sp. NPDC052701 TaxID=3155533 RepID=UPI0034157A91